MEPRDLLRRLMADQNLNPSSLSRATRGQTKQPTIHRFLAGVAAEPKRSTLEPVARHFGVPVDAFFDPRAADQVFASRFGGTDSSPVAAAEPPAVYALQDQTPAVDQRMAQLLLDLEDLRPVRRSALIDMIHQEAEEARAAAAYLAQKKAAIGTAAAKKQPERPARLNIPVHRGGSNAAQAELKLTTVDDPFTAEPHQRELVFYERLSKRRGQ